MSCLRNNISVLLISSLLMMLCSCGTSRRNAVTAGNGRGSANTVAEGRKQLSHSRDDMPNEAASLLAEAEKWLGTKYKYGGNSRSGVDCSGFVTQVYLKALDIKLPRSSAQQQQWCEPVKRSELMAGDLVFFNTSGGKKVSHVGMYVGDGKMIHASTSAGVIVSALDETYYKKRYHSSGRVGQYYAMVKKSSGKKQKRDKKNADTKAGKESGPASGKNAGVREVRFDEVDALLARDSKGDDSGNKVGKSKRVDRKTPSPDRVAVSRTKKAERKSNDVPVKLDPDEARRKVLNELPDELPDSVTVKK